MKLNVSIFVSSLNYIQKYRQICSLASWIYDELRSINYSDSKFKMCIIKVDILVIKDIVHLAKDFKDDSIFSHWFMTSDIAMLLLENGFKITELQLDTFINRAVLYNNIVFLECLIKRCTVKHCRSILKTAVQRNHLDAVKLLCRFHSVSVLEASQCIDIICMRNLADILEVLIDNGMTTETIHLDDAVMYKSIDVIKVLLKHVRPNASILLQVCHSDIKIFSLFEKYLDIQFLDVANKCGNYKLVELILENKARHEQSKSWQLLFDTNIIYNKSKTVEKSSFERSSVCSLI